MSPCRVVTSGWKSGILEKVEGPSEYESEGPSCTSALLNRVSPLTSLTCCTVLSLEFDWPLVTRLPIVELPPARAVLSVRAPGEGSNASVLGFPFPIAGVAPWNLRPFAPPARQFALFDVGSVARSIIS